MFESAFFAYFNMPMFYLCCSGESGALEVRAQFAAQPLDHRRGARPLVRALRPQHQHFLVLEPENRTLVVDCAAGVRSRLLLRVGPVAAPVHQRVRLQPAVPRSIRHPSGLSCAPHDCPLVDLPCVRSQKRERGVPKLQRVRQPLRQKHRRRLDYGAGKQARLCVSKVQARPKTRSSKAELASK